MLQLIGFIVLIYWLGFFKASVIALLLLILAK